MPPSRPPQQLNIASEPNLEAGTAHEDIINGYRQREWDVADASDELRRNLEQLEGMRKRGAGIHRFIDSVPLSSASLSSTSIHPEDWLFDIDGVWIHNQELARATLLDFLLMLYLKLAHVRTWCKLQ